MAGDKADSEFVYPAALQKTMVNAWGRSLEGLRHAACPYCGYRILASALFDTGEGEPSGQVGPAAPLGTAAQFFDFPARRNAATRARRSAV